MENFADVPPLPYDPDAMPPPPKAVNDDWTPEPVDVNALSNIELTWPQYDFVTSVAKFPAMVAGYGSGKTHGAVVRALRLKLAYPEQCVGYYLPTYDLVAKIAYPRFEEILIACNFKYILNKVDHELTIFGVGKIIIRTMDRPERIIGYEHADAVADELDTLKMDKAAEVWRKIIARNRQKKPDRTINTIAVATTPEGFRFVYEKWKRNPLKGSQLIKASTHSNAHNLPEDYIDTLKENYSDAMLAAYLDGEFVNLTQGAVYPEFDRELNACTDTVQEKETLHIGVDFNVGHMAAVVHVLRDGEPRAVDEFVDYLDTPALIAAIDERYRSKGHRIIVYPDATGKNRKSNNAAQSDIALLRQAGFMVLAHSTNPFVRDRVAAVNKLVHKETKRVYRINGDKCPHLVEAFETQAYDKNGEPDKTSGFDHVLDGAGYFVAYRWPVRYGVAVQTNVTGI